MSEVVPVKNLMGGFSRKYAQSSPTTKRSSNFLGGGNQCFVGVSLTGRFLLMSSNGLGIVGGSWRGRAALRHQGGGGTPMEFVGVPKEGLICPHAYRSAQKNNLIKLDK